MHLKTLDSNNPRLIVLMWINRKQEEVITLFLFPLNPEFILFFTKFEVIIQIILYFNAQANPGTKPHRWLWLRSRVCCFINATEIHHNFSSITEPHLTIQYFISSYVARDLLKSFQKISSFNSCKQLWRYWLRKP